MSNLEEFIEQLSFEVESEHQIDKILEDLEREGMTVLHEGDSLKQDMYIVNPFMLLSFSPDGDSYSNSMVEYCKRAVDFFNRHKAVSQKVSFVPPINSRNKKAVLGFSCFCDASIKYVINTKNADSIGNKDSVVEFFRITQSTTPKYVQQNVTGESFFKNRDTSSYLFVPKNQKEDSSTNYLNNAEASVSIDYSTTIYELIPKIYELSMDIQNHKDSINKTNPTGRISQVDKYIVYLVDYCIKHPDVVKNDVTAIMSGDVTKFSQFGKHLGSGSDNPYKNSKLDRQQYGTTDNLNGTMVGDFVNWTAKNAGVDDDSWEKTKKNLKATLDKKTLDNDLEKIYNGKHLVKDAFGIEDTEDRYDAAAYEDPNRDNKIKDVAGKDIFEIDKKIKKYQHEVDKINLMLIEDDNKLEAVERDNLIKKRDLYKQDIQDLERDKVHHASKLDSDEIERALGKEKDKSTIKAEDGLRNVDTSKVISYVSRLSNGELLKRMLCRA